MMATGVNRKQHTECETVKNSIEGESGCQIEVMAQLSVLIDEVEELKNSWDHLRLSISLLLWCGPVNVEEDIPSVPISNHPLGDLIRSVRQSVIDLKYQINDTNSELYIGTKDVKAVRN